MKIMIGGINLISTRDIKERGYEKDGQGRHERRAQITGLYAFELHINSPKEFFVFVVPRTREHSDADTGHRFWFRRW